MATALLCISWNRPIAGKEAEAWKYFIEEGDTALSKFQKQGYFERVERVALTPHGGTINGFLLLFGERAKLDELRRTDEFERFSIKLSMLFEGYGVVPGLNNEGLAKAMGRMKDMLT
jgi:hypothetical protein